jgi:hypothetical protein
MTKKRDNIVAHIANWFIKTFASKEYVDSLERVIYVGMCTLNAAVIQERKTPNEPYAIQVGFNGHEPIISTLTKAYQESDTAK